MKCLQKIVTDIQVNEQTFTNKHLDFYVYFLANATSSLLRETSLYIPIWLKRSRNSLSLAWVSAAPEGTKYSIKNKSIVTRWKGIVFSISNSAPSIFNQEKLVCVILIAFKMEYSGMHKTSSGLISG